MQSNSTFDQMLTSEWDQKYDGPIKMFRSYLESVHQKEIKDSPFYAYSNHQLIQNKRTHIIDPIKASNDVQVLIQDYDESNFNFTKIEKYEVLLYVDLEGQQILKNLDDENDKQLNHEHPLIINTSPVCRYHTVWPLFVNSQLPQVLSGQLINCGLNMFLMSQNNSLRMGFNSTGAYSTVNHFHLQTIYCDKLIPEFPMFPIERFPKELLFKTKRVNIEDATQNLEVHVSFIQGYPLHAYCLQCIPAPVYSDQVPLAYSLLSDVCQVFVELFMDYKIPHNFMISDRGLSIYIYPRKWQQLHNPDQHVRAAWIELSGLAIIRDQEFYEKITAEWFDEYLRDQCSIDEELFLGMGKQAEDKLNVKI